MSGLNHAIPLSLLAVLFFCLSGCGVSEEEHQNVVSQLDKVKTELDEVRALLNKKESELAETKTALSHETKRVLDSEKTVMKAQDQLKSEKQKHRQERQALQSPLTAARNESDYLRQKLEEMTQNFFKVSRELEMIKQANQILKEQINETTLEKRRFQEMVKTQERKITDLENRFGELQTQPKSLPSSPPK